MISPGLITKGFGTENIITKGYGGIFEPIIKVVTETVRRIGKGGSNAYYQAKNYIVQLKEMVVYGRMVQKTTNNQINEVTGHEKHKFYNDRIVEIRAESLEKGDSSPAKTILVEVERAEPIESEYLVKEALLYTKGITKK